MIMSDSPFRFLPSHVLIPTLAIAVLAFAGGCSSAGEQGPGTDAPIGPLSFETVEQSHVDPESVDESAAGEFEDGVQRVIRDRDAFESFWQDLHGEDASMPQINFSEKVVVVVMLGEKPNDEYEAKITSITKNTNPTLVSVFVEKIVPVENCSATDSDVIPYHIVKVDGFATDKVSFQDDGTEEKECG